MDLMHVEPAFTGSVWAISVLSGVLVLAGLPLASIGLTLSTLTRRRAIRWPSRWFRVFQIGFVIQICSVVVSSALSVILLPLLPSGTVWESLLPPVIFVVSAVGGGFTLTAWLGLMAAIRLEAPPSLLR
jgi:hypothetical protein